MSASNRDLQKYDDVLLPFLSLMRSELHANAGKGDRPGWLQMTSDQALLEVYYHLAKLQKAVNSGDLSAIRENAADVANMAMMVLDVCGGLPALATPPTQPVAGEAQINPAGWDGSQEFDLSSPEDLVHALKCIRNGLLEYSWIERTLTCACDALATPPTQPVAGEAWREAISEALVYLGDDPIGPDSEPSACVNNLMRAAANIGAETDAALAALLVETSATPPTQPPEQAPHNWRAVINKARSGLAAGSRSPSNTDFEVDFGSALIDSIAEGLELLETPEQARDGERPYVLAVSKSEVKALADFHDMQQEDADSCGARTEGDRVRASELRAAISQDSAEVGK